MHGNQLVFLEKINTKTYNFLYFHFISTKHANATMNLFRAFVLLINNDDDDEFDSHNCLFCNFKLFQIVCNHDRWEIFLQFLFALNLKHGIFSCDILNMPDFISKMDRKNNVNLLSDLKESHSLLWFYIQYRMCTVVHEKGFFWMFYSILLKLQNR